MKAAKKHINRFRKNLKQFVKLKANGTLNGSAAAIKEKLQHAAGEVDLDFEKELKKLTKQARKNPEKPVSAKEIKTLVKKALANKDFKDFLDIAAVKKSQAKKIKKLTGIDARNYTYLLQADAVRHVINEHGDEEQEEKRGQRPITPKDFEGLVDVLNNPDAIKKGKTSKRGLQTVIYQKRINGNLICVQEIRTGREKLALNTMWKYRIKGPRANPKNGCVAHTSETCLNHDTSTKKEDTKNSKKRENPDEPEELKTLVQAYAPEAYMDNRPQAGAGFEFQNTQNSDKRENPCGCETRENPVTFIENSQGKLNFGEITNPIAKRIKRQAGYIRLTKEGLEHIESHKNQIQSVGFDSEIAFAQSVATSFDAIYKGKGRSLILALTNRPDRMAYIKLEPTQLGDFYLIDSAFPVRSDFFKNKKPLWEKAQSTHRKNATPSAVSGHNGSESQDTEKDNKRENPETALKKVENSKATVQAKTNDHKEGIEVRFSEEPPDKVKSKLKSNGFLFYTPKGKSPFWSAKKSKKAKAVAESIAGKFKDSQLNIFSDDYASLSGKSEKQKIVSINDLKAGDKVQPVGRYITSGGFYFTPTKLLTVIRINKKSITVDTKDGKQTRIPKKATRQSFSGGKKHDTTPEFRLIKRKKPVRVNPEKRVEQKVHEIIVHAQRLQNFGHDNSDDEAKLDYLLGSDGWKWNEGKSKIIRDSSSTIQHSTLRTNPTARFIYLGICDRLLVDQGREVPTTLQGPHGLLTNKAMNRLFIVPFKMMHNIDDKVADMAADQVFEKWNNYAPDNKNYKFKWPEWKPNEPVGTADEIYYVSDKILREWDHKGKLNMYHHEFDPGKRPCLKKGNMLIITNVKINENGILN